MVTWNFSRLEKRCLIKLTKEKSLFWHSRVQFEMDLLLLNYFFSNCVHFCEKVSSIYLVAAVISLLVTSFCGKLWGFFIFFYRAFLKNSFIIRHVSFPSSLKYFFLIMPLFYFWVELNVPINFFYALLVIFLISI